MEHVVYDPNSGQYSLTYVTTANEKEFKFETDVFDCKFEFVELVEDQIEFEKAKGKYKWFKFKGADYVVIGNFVELNLIGTLVIQKKEITYIKRDWCNGEYYKKVNVLEKVKLVGEAGDKLYYYGHTEDENNGDILIIICGIKENPKDGGDINGYAKNFASIQFNKDLDAASYENFSSDHPQIPVFQRRMPTNSEDRDYDGLVAVFAPLGGMRYNKIAQPQKNLYTYVSCNHEGKILENIRFTSPETQWMIHEMVAENSKTRVYLYGAAASNKGKYQNQMVGTKNSILCS